MHRFVLAEFNTHRVFSRNSASSRAIPVEKQLARLLESPAMPLSWPVEQPGMQGGSNLEDQYLIDAQELFSDAHGAITELIQAYLLAHPEKASRLHKSLINRLMEPWMWHRVVVTSTEWQGFWEQRSSVYSPLAQPEIAAAADLMLAAYNESVPTELDYGQWHLPYILDSDRDWACDFSLALAMEGNGGDTSATPLSLLREVSSARCARTSYDTQDGTRDQEEDLRLHGRLISARPLHASPMEHQATPATADEITRGLVKGNLHGFHQYRAQVEAAA